MTPTVVSPAREATSRNSAPGNSASALGSAKASSGFSRRCELDWIKHFHSADPSIRDSWLERARSTGLLHSHEIGWRNTRAPSELIVDLLTGPIEIEPLDSEPAGVESLTVYDEGLDPAQRAAVGQALRSVDLFLIVGGPGTGKSRTLAELICQAAARSWRTLLVAPTMSCLEQCLKRLPAPELVLAACLLDPEEELRHAPALLREHSLQRLQERVVQSVRQRAVISRDKCSAELEELRLKIEKLERLRPLAVEWQALEDRRAQLTAERQQVQTSVLAEMEGAPPRVQGSPVAELLEQERLRHEGALLELDKQIQKAQESVAACDLELRKWQAQVLAQQEVVAIRKQWRPFSLKFWRGLLQGRAVQRLEEFNHRSDEARMAFEHADAVHKGLLQQQLTEIQRHKTAREQIAFNETSRRTAELDEQIRSIAEGQDQLSQAWASHALHLGANEGLASSPSAASVESLERSIREQIEVAERNYQFFSAWQDEATHSSSIIAEESLASHATLLAVTTASLQSSSVAALLGDHFDLVIIDQADRLTAEHIQTVTTLGQRCVLSGHPPLGTGCLDSTSCTLTERSIFHELYHSLHPGLTSARCRWLQLDSAIVCQLTELDEAARSALESERLVDQTDVELRILNQPGSRPILAEVVFTGNSFDVPSAKAYLYQQLGELTLRPEAGHYQWVETGSLLQLEFGQGTPTNQAHSRLELEPGVFEVVARTHRGPPRESNESWSTVRLEFDRSEGWNRARAARWLREKIGLIDLGRCAWLRRNYRAETEALANLARFTLNPSLNPLEADVAADRSVQFIPVRSHAVSRQVSGKQNKARGSANGSAGSVSGELDLADPRQRQRIPLELQLKLPMRGLVNLAEAEQIVRLLQDLAQIPKSDNQRSEDIAVLSWMAPQVQLVEYLWRRSPEAAASSLPGLRFAAIPDFRECEADTVVVSLVRSHEQRQLDFTDSPRDWVVLIGSARRHLVLVGDPDTLQRRGRTQPNVHSPDDPRAAFEQLICARLMRQLLPFASVGRPSLHCEGTPK